MKSILKIIESIPVVKNVMQVSKTFFRSVPDGVDSLNHDPKVAPKDEHGVRLHKHSFFTAYVENPPQDEKSCEDWFNRLIQKIDMKVMVKPKAYYCDKDGNRGLTCVAIIETSHIALHAWDECSPGLIELDVFSCKDYDINDVLTLLKEFGLKAVNFRCIDRTNGLSDAKLHFVYKTTNLLNDKIYVGVHSDFSCDYDYLGSGKHISASVEKYGKENFSHEIIAVFHDEEGAYDLESKIVDYEFYSSESTYNLAPGSKPGRVGPMLDSTKETISQDNKGRVLDIKWITNGQENLYLKGPYHAEYVATGEWQYGRTISRETKDKMSVVGKGRPSHHKDQTLP